jgi:hypothetical protein
MLFVLAALSQPCIGHCSVLNDGAEITTRADLVGCQKSK